MSDPARYRTKEEVDIYKNKDPLSDVKNIILINKYAKEEDLKLIEKSIKDIVQDAVEFSENSPMPSEDELFTNIYN